MGRCRNLRDARRVRFGDHNLRRELLDGDRGHGEKPRRPHWNADNGIREIGGIARSSKNRLAWKRLKRASSAGLVSVDEPANVVSLQQFVNRDSSLGVVALDEPSSVVSFQEFVNRDSSL